MTICAHCGVQNNDDHRFCKQCGRPLTFTTSSDVDDNTLIIQLLEGHGITPTTGRVARLWLLDLSGEHVERVYELSDEQVIVGRREGCAVCLPGSTISRRHAQIRHVDGQYYISDFGSTNGTLLNGEPLIGEEQLRDRDEIGVGIYKLIFRLT